MPAASFVGRVRSSRLRGAGGGRGEASCQSVAKKRLDEGYPGKTSVSRSPLAPISPAQRALVDSSSIRCSAVNYLAYSPEALLPHERQPRCSHHRAWRIDLAEGRIDSLRFALR